MVMNSINMRSSKMKFLIYGCVICGMLSTIYLLSSTHTRLKNVKGAYDSCLQQKDSLLAQIQVVYEQKSRVEKSLQKEKSDHTKTREEYQETSHIKLVLEREKQDAEGKYNTLQQEHQSLQDKFTQLTSDSNQLTEKLSQLEDNFHKYQAEAEKLAQTKDNEVKKLNAEISTLILSNEQLRINYNKGEKNLQSLTEKLSSIQALNSHLQDRVSNPKVEAFKQITPEKRLNMTNGASQDKPQETNVHASPTESNKVQSQDNYKLKNGGGDIDPAKASSTNNETHNKGGGIETGGYGALINGDASKNDVNGKPETNDVNGKPETNDINIKPDEEKRKAQAALSLNEKLPENVPAKTLDKPKTSETSTSKPESQLPLQKPKLEYQKEENNQVLPQPSNLDNEQKDTEDKGLEGDIGAQAQNDKDFNHPQENGDINVAVPWEKSGLKRGPQLKQLNVGGAMAGPQINHQNEDDEYHDEDEDAAEEEGGDEALPAGEKMVHEKHFQDHDFEDNEGDQNRAKEEGHEGVVVLPK